jgi:tetratricopeptide (TPR) repeat protein
MYRLTILFLLIGLSSFAQLPNEKKRDSVVSSLTNKIVPLVEYINNPDSSGKALSYLDSATVIDNSCFICYYNKLMFLFSLGNYKKAISVVDKIISLRPYAYDLYLIGGFVCEKTNDTTESKKYFEKSLRICITVLDTIKERNSQYSMLMGNKIIILKMLGEHKKVEETMETLKSAKADEDFKQFALSLAQKTKQELLEDLFSRSNSR